MSLTRKSAIVEIGTSPTTLVQADSAEQVVVVSLILGNVDGTDNTLVGLQLTKLGESAVDIVTLVPIEVGEAVQIFVGGKDGLFLEVGDTLSAYKEASPGGDVNATVSYIVEA